VIDLSQAVKEYVIGTYVITFVYRCQEEGKTLRYISMRPLSPYDAEFLKTMVETPLDWSFDKDSGTVKLWPRNIKEKIGRDIEKAIITHLFRIVPEIRKELSEDSIIEKLVERDWLVSKQNKVIVCRKPLESNGHEGYLEVFLEGNEAWYMVRVKVRVIESNFNKYQHMKMRLREMFEGKMIEQYPFLTLEFNLGEYIAPELLKKLDEIYETLRGVVFG